MHVFLRIKQHWEFEPVLKVPFGYEFSFLDQKHLVMTDTKYENFVNAKFSCKIIRFSRQIVRPASNSCCTQPFSAQKPSPATFNFSLAAPLTLICLKVIKFIKVRLIEVYRFKKFTVFKFHLRSLYS